MNGIAFSGGGLKGAYQVGAYKAFLDCNIKIDGFVGTSIGALNAAIIASGKYEELFDFAANIKWTTYLIASICIFTLSYIVSIFLSKKINNIDMVTSLKVNE